MKREDLTDAIGGIDMDILEESQKLRQNRRKRTTVWPAVAAGIVFFLAAALVLFVIRNNTAPATGKDPGHTAAVTRTEETADTESREDPAADTESREDPAEDTEDSQAGSEEETVKDRETVQPEETAPAEDAEEMKGMGAPQKIVIKMTPDAEPEDRRVLFADDNYQIWRAGPETGGPQYFVMFRKDNGAWGVASWISSEKRSMEDRVTELQGMAEVFWEYYKTAYPVTEEWIRRAEDFLRENYIAREYDPLNADPAETLSEDERRMLRDHVEFSYDEKMTESFVPDLIAFEFGSGSGYLRFLQPIFVMKMICPETDDPALAKLMIKDIGDRKEQYYGISARVNQEGVVNADAFMVTPDADTYFEGMTAGAWWMSGGSQAYDSDPADGQEAQENGGWTGYRFDGLCISVPEDWNVQRTIYDFVIHSENGSEIIISTNTETRKDLAELDPVFAFEDPDKLWEDFRKASLSVAGAESLEAFAFSLNGLDCKLHYANNRRYAVNDGGEQTEEPPAEPDVVFMTFTEGDKIGCVQAWLPGEDVDVYETALFRMLLSLSWPKAETGGAADMADDAASADNAEAADPPDTSSQWTDLSLAGIRCRVSEDWALLLSDEGSHVYSYSSRDGSAMHYIMRASDERNGLTRERLLDDVYLPLGTKNSVISEQELDTVELNGLKARFTLLEMSAGDFDFSLTSAEKPLKVIYAVYWDDETAAACISYYGDPETGLDQARPEILHLLTSFAKE